MIIFIIVGLLFLFSCYFFLRFFYRRSDQIKLERKAILRHNRSLVAQRRPLSEDEEIERYHKRMALEQAYQGKHVHFSKLGKHTDLYYYGKHADRSSEPLSSYSSSSYTPDRKKKDGNGGGLFNLFD